MAGSRGILADLQDTDVDAIRTRFRKLRLRSFPDDINPGTGLRVRYDLPRALAISTVFELNSLLIPQGSAIHLVELAWPEICRAAIAAGVAADVLPRPRAMPSAAGPVVVMMPNAFAIGPPADAVPARIAKADESATAAPTIRLDLSRLVGMLKAVDGGGLPDAMDALERRFGWTEATLPRGRAKSVPRSGTFLDEGPYLQRAAALLAADDEEFDADLSSASAARLQALLDYLLTPSPVDVWKGEIGESADGLRLKHLLSIYGEERKLKPSKVYPGHLAIRAGEDVGDLARRFVATVRR